MIKIVRQIQLNKIASLPNHYKAIITYETHPTEYDESDDLEYQKALMNKLLIVFWNTKKTKVNNKKYSKEGLWD